MASAISVLSAITLLRTAGSVTQTSGKEMVRAAAIRYVPARTNHTWLAFAMSFIISVRLANAEAMESTHIRNLI
jgi:hypothetical protein